MTVEQGSHRPDPKMPGCEVLRHWEERREPAPPFESVRHRIAATPSPLDRARWTIGRSVRLAGALAAAQLRIVPWLVAPVGLAAMAMAVLAARYFGAARDVCAAASGFSSVVLLGIVVTMAMALSAGASDAVCLATPLGPQAVVLARATMVLAIDGFAALAASALLAAWGVAGSFGTVVAGWLVPLALVAALATSATIWVAPWAGIVLGVAAIPLFGPPSQLWPSVGFGAFSQAIRDVVTPAGTVVLGVALLALAIASARRALLARSGVI